MHTPWQYIFLMGLPAVLVCFGLYALICRLTRDSASNAKTVSATFLAHRSSLNKTEIRDRERAATGNTSVGFERHTLVFWDEEAERPLQFAFSGDLPQNWKPEQHGQLTYSGKRFIKFQPQ